MAPTQRRDQIRFAGGNHRDPQGDRIGAIDRRQIAIDLGQRLGRHARAGEIGTRDGMDRPAVEPRAAPRLRAEDRGARRRIEHADHGLALLDQRDRDGPALPPAQVIARAVDRIDDPHQRPGEPIGIVDRFLGQPSRLGHQDGQPLAKQRIHIQIDLAYRMARRFLPTPEIRAPTRHRQRAGLRRDRRDGIGQRFSHSPPSCHRYAASAR